MSSFIQIGSGDIIFNPTAGNLTANPTPLSAFTIQSMSIDMKGTVEELKGQNQFPDDTAVTDKKGSGKIKMGRIDLTLLNQVFFADVVTAGGNSVAYQEAHTVPASSVYTVTVTPPASGTFYQDLGVNYASNPAQGAFTRVASSPTAGQYTQAAGVYTFAAGDASMAVLITYAYTLASAGSQFQVNNQAIGFAPQVEIWVRDTYQPKLVSGVYVYPTIHIHAAKITGITLGNERDKYSMPELDYSYYQGPDGRVMDIYSPY